MKRIITRAWRYLEAAFERRLEQAADPRVQIEQAIEEAKRQHALLTQQAAEVVGNERELDIRINRALDTIERLKASITQAIRMEDRVRREGDAQKAAHYASAADATGDRPPDVMARRLFAHDGVKTVHVFANEVTVELFPWKTTDGLKEAIEGLHTHYLPGVLPSLQ